MNEAADAAPVPARKHTGFSRLDALAFSLSTLGMAFIRFLAIRTAFGDEAFRSYALWLTLAQGAAEFLNMVVDSHRAREHGFPRVALLAVVYAGVIGTAASWAEGAGPAVQLVCYTLVDGMLFVDVAYRDRWLNWLLQALRAAVIALIFFKLLWAIVLVAVIAAALVTPGAWATRTPFHVDSAGVLARCVAVTAASRGRDWVVTLVTQLALPGGTYFYFYMALKLGMNLAAASYTMLRSSLAFDVAAAHRKLVEIVHDKRIFAGWAAIVAAGVGLGLGRWLFVVMIMLENLAAQASLFGIMNGLDKLLLVNLVGLAGGLLAWALLPLSPFAVWAILPLVISINIGIFASDGRFFDRFRRPLS